MIPTWVIVVYMIGAVVTFIYNMWDMVFITSYLAIARNVIFWPVFLPILIVLRSLD